MKQHENIKNFLNLVKDRLNKALLFRTVQWSFLVTGLALLIIAATFVLCGRAVPIWIYFTALACTAVSIAAVWALYRRDLAQATRFADNFFNLHDSVTSYTKFESQGKQGGFYDLQADQTDDSVQHTDNPEHIPLGISKRVCTAAFALMIAALSMGFIPESDAVRNARLAKEDTLYKTSQVNSELKNELADVLKELEKEQEDPETKEKINDLKKQVEDLKQTDDLKEAMSQYAKLEKELHKMLNSAQQRKDELLLDRVSDKLKSIRDGRQLGNKLSKKDYKDAAEELKKMKMKKPKELSKEDLKKLAKLKNISQQMAAAAESSMSKMSESSQSNSDKSNSSKSLSQKMTELKEAVEKMEKSQCKSCDGANAKMDDLAATLSKLAGKRSMQAKMKSLSQKLGQCQGYMAMAGPPGQCKSLAACISQSKAKGEGGKGAGMGSDDKTANAATPDVNNDNYTRLTGIKNEGPSDVTVEEASSGTGSNTSAVAKRQLEYKKQAEAYILRQDVPSEVKQGVKRYFENIHTVESQD